MPDRNSLDSLDLSKNGQDIVIPTRNNPFSNLWNSLIRFGFHLLYNQMAFFYDAVSWVASLGLWQDWQLSALPYLNGPVVLEIAHGPGHMLAALNKSGFQVAGIDLSPQMTYLAKKRINNEGLDIALARSCAQKLPFAPQIFNSVLSTFPTEFIFEQSTLRAVHLVLKPGGVFVIVPGAELVGSSFIVKVIEWLYYITGQRDEITAAGSINDRRKKTQLEQLNEIFERAGFSLKIKTIPLKNSKVTLLIAQKI